MILAVCAPLPAASLDPSVRKGKGTVSKDDVRKAIVIFRRNPLSIQGELTRPIITSFAKESPDVEIALTEKKLPWIDDKSTPSETGQILLVAYMAGDILAQLDKGRTKEESVASIEQVIVTYRQLQGANPKLEVASVEKFISLQKQGKLAGYLKED